MSFAFFKLPPPGLATASFTLAIPHQRRADAYTDPRLTGGSMLDSSAGLGEPLNVIISGLSTPSVLSTAGVETWARSVGYSTECLGIHEGNPQTANTGDGRGWTNEIAVIRYDFGDSVLGSCLESLSGGNHFRFWEQTTTKAYFLAVSYEEWAGENHTIEPDGYDIGRDDLVQAATANPTSYGGVIYKTTVQYVTGLLQPGSAGINHNIAIDGRVAVLTITASK